MIKAIDIQAALTGRPLLDGRGAATEADAADAFAELARFRDGASLPEAFPAQARGSVTATATSWCMSWPGPPS